MAATSAVPATIDALLALFAGALDPDSAIDGPGDSAAYPDRYVLVGVDAPDAEGLITAAEGDQAWAWLGHDQRDETFTVPCVAVVIDGDSDQKAARDGVYALLATLVDALQADPTLGGVLLYAAGVTGQQLEQAQGERGAVAQLRFKVSCRARLS